MNEWSTEKREDTVAGGLHDVAVVAMDRIHHQRQRRIDSGARLFGVEVLHHLGGSLDVSEQGSDCLALALQAFGLSLPKILYEPEFERLRELVSN